MNRILLKRCLWMGLTMTTSLVTLCCSIMTIGPDEFLHGSYGRDRQTVCRPSYWLFGRQQCREEWISRTKLQWKPQYYVSYGRGLALTTTSFFTTIALISMIPTILTATSSWHQQQRGILPSPRLAERFIKIASMTSLLTTVMYSLLTKGPNAFFAINIWISVGLSLVWICLAGLLSIAIRVNENVSTRRKRVPRAIVVTTVVLAFLYTLWAEIGGIISCTIAVLLYAFHYTLLVVIGEGISCTTALLGGADFFDRNSLHQAAESAGFFYSIVTWYLIAGVGVPGYKFVVWDSNTPQNK